MTFLSYVTSATGELYLLQGKRTDWNIKCHMLRSGEKSFLQPPPSLFLIGIKVMIAKHKETKRICKVSFPLCIMLSGVSTLLDVLDTIRFWKICCLIDFISPPLETAPMILLLISNSVGRLWQTAISLETIVLSKKKSHDFYLDHTQSPNMLRQTGTIQSYCCAHFVRLAASKRQRV